jgi:LacI family transcriptional regulator
MPQAEFALGHATKSHFLFHVRPEVKADSMRKTQRRVLLVTDYYDYRAIRGIEKYAQEHDWNLLPDVTQDRKIPWGWTGDGILAWLAASDEMADFVLDAKKPTVDLTFRHPHLKFPRVLMDNFRISQLVAEHYLSRGFTNFAFYSDYENWSFEERGKAFVDILQRAGQECTWLCWYRSPAYYPGGRLEGWRLRQKWLSSELRKAAKPLAVFAATDWLAVDVLQTCESSGLAVPDDVAIVGSHNTLLAVDTMRTPITTVEPNLEGMGYRGAALLDDLMNGAVPPEEPVRWPPAGLIVRKSSDLFAIDHQGIARSLRFMWEHYREPIGVADLAKVAGMSLRRYHEAVQHHIGLSPGRELHRVRIEHAKQMLISSTEKTESVANMCGYQNLNSFWVAFRKATGMSPKQYRKKFSRRL